MGRRQVVRHWVLVPAFAGSNPADPAKYNRLGLVSSLLYLMDSPEFEGLRFVIEHSEIDFPADPARESPEHLLWIFSALRTRQERTVGSERKSGCRQKVSLLTFWPLRVRKIIA